MPPMTLKMRISVALLVAFVLVAGIATAFAQASFRETEVRHVREDSQARVEAIAGLLEAQFAQLGRETRVAADDVGVEEKDAILDGLRLAGFTSIVVIPKSAPHIHLGEVETNGTLHQLMLAEIPDRSVRYAYVDGWFIIAARSTDRESTVIGALPSRYLSEVYLAAILRHPDYAHAVVMADGSVLAASPDYPGERSTLRIVNAEETGFLDHFQRTDEHYAQSAGLVVLDAYVEGLAPSAAIDARVNGMTLRFLLAMAVAFGIGGAVTILLVTYSFRPLDRITDAARRLGRGEEHLQLEVRDRDELGLLADALNSSAQAIATARRAEAERAEESRLAAEDFELAVGDLSRSVGEADTPHDVAARLAEGLLRVTSGRAVLVQYAHETLATADRSEEATTAAELDALFATAAEAFHVARARSGEAELVVAVLPYEACTLPTTELRKIDILAAQAAIAVHRARATVELRRATAQKETFLDILSHDLKNPLAVARGRVELLARKAPDHSDKLTQIETSLDRATRIIEEAVLLSKLERGDALERSPLDLVALVEESAAALRPLAAPRGIAIRVDAPGAIRWPANRILQRAVENLISNAIKWSPEGSQVELALDADDGGCRLRVIDHGPGIPDEDKARLFARFERADRTGVKGTGLGLAIAKRVTDMHGGSVRIEDTPGGGCTFVLDLPLPNPAPQPAPTTGGGGA